VLDNNLNITLIDLTDCPEFVANFKSYEDVRDWIEEEHNIKLQEWLDLEPESDFNLDNYSLSEVLEEWLCCEELNIKIYETNIA
jgi:hypothetical protein